MARAAGVDPDAAADLQVAADVIRVRSHDAGIDNRETLDAMTTDADWLRHRAKTLLDAGTDF